MHSLKHLYPIELSITHSHVPLLSDEELASLNELRVDEDLDFSDLDSSPEDVSLLDPGMDFNASLDSFQEQEIDPVCDESNLVNDPEDPLPDNALSLEDIASSNFVPALEEPIFSDHAASNEINVSPAATLSSTESEDILPSSQDISAALPSLEGKSMTDPSFAAALPSSLPSRRSRRIIKPKCPLDEEFIYYK